MNESFGPIEALWRAAGFESAAAAASAASITPQTLSHWMAGRHLPARLSKVRAAAKAWKIAPEAVLEALHAELVRALPPHRRRKAVSAA